MLGRFSSRQRGFTLIEIMIALTIFAVAILGMSSLQVRSFSTSLDLSQRALISQALQDFSIRVRGNPAAVDDYQGVYTQNSCTNPAVVCADKVGSGATACSAAQMAIYDKWAAFCGDANATKLENKVIGWSIAAVCTDATADCSETTAQMRVVASWTRRRGSVDNLISGTATVNVLGTGAVQASTELDQMVLVFSPW